MDDKFVLVSLEYSETSNEISVKYFKTGEFLGTMKRRTNDIFAWTTNKVVRTDRSKGLVIVTRKYGEYSGTTRGLTEALYEMLNRQCHVQWSNLSGD